MRENAQPIADVLVKEVAKPAVDAYTGVCRSRLASCLPAPAAWGLSSGPGLRRWLHGMPKLCCWEARHCCRAHC